MKKNKIIYTGLIALFTSINLFAQQGIGTNNPHKSSVLELKSEKRGLLIPRVNLTARNVKAPVQDPENSLLVFNEATNASGDNKVTPGYYYWNQTENKWMRLANQQDVSASSSKVTGGQLSGTNLVLNQSGGAGNVSIDLSALATDTNTQSREVVEAGTGIKVTATGTTGSDDRKFTVEIKPAANNETKVLGSTNGVVGWVDASSSSSSAPLTSNNVVTKVNTVDAAGDTSHAWDSPTGDPNDGYYLLVLKNGFTGGVNLPDPSGFKDRMIAIQNISGSARTFGLNPPENVGSIGSNRAQQLVSDGTSWYIAGGL